MRLRPVTDDDRALLRAACLVNMNWVEPRFSLQDLDDRPELAHYYSAYDASRDFGLAAVDDDDDAVTAVAWVVFLPADDPGYGFVADGVPELSITAFDGHRGRGLGAAVLDAVIDEARRRALVGISLSVEDGNRARHLYERAGFRVVGRNGNADTMLLELG
jgi:GNAT superfamily N-acetyltransferase